MTDRPLRAALLTSLFLALAAPAWPCGPPAGGCGHRGTSSSGQTGDRNSGEGNRGGDRGGSWENGAAEDARQGAAAGAAGDTGGGNAGPRSTESSDQSSSDHTSQIQALGKAEQSNCETLRAQASEVQSQLDMSHEYQARAYSDLQDKQQDAKAISAMIAIRDPAKLDKIIASLDDVTTNNPRIKALRDYLVERRLLGSSDPTRLNNYYQQAVVDAQAKVKMSLEGEATLQGRLESLQTQLQGCLGQ
jgi:hypothetical protein